MLYDWKCKIQCFGSDMTRCPNSTFSHGCKLFIIFCSFGGASATVNIHETMVISFSAVLFIKLGSKENLCLGFH